MLTYTFNISGFDGEQCEINTQSTLSMTTMLTTVIPFCNDTDSCDGHYTCLYDGSFECLDGWEDVDNFCKVNKHMWFIYFIIRF